MTDKLSPPSALNTPKKRKKWWYALETQWKKAFNQAVLHKEPSDELPTDDELLDLATVSVMRFAGPTSPAPSISFELTNLSGITELTNLEILVAIFCKLTSMEEVAKLTKLNSLFVYENQITSMRGVENLRSLKELYVNVNQISSIKEIRYLLHLETFYCTNNAITSLEGLTEKHSDKLTRFFCLPNDALHQREILRTERELGIRCLKA